MDFPYVKIVVFVPMSHSDAVRESLSQNGAGHIGNYNSCSFSSIGVGRFRPGDDTKPFIGSTGQLEEVDEERIETICPSEKMDIVLEAINKVHPYEEPAIDIYPLLNQK